MSHRKDVKLVMILLAIFGAVVVAIFIFFSILFSGWRTDSNAQKAITSPDGDYIAVASVTNGGATTDFGVVVTIIESHDLVNNSAKCFKVFSAYNTDNVDIQWISDDELEIWASSKATGIKKTEKYKEVLFSYQIDLPAYTK
jgi:hypothetical protein